MSEPADLAGEAPEHIGRLLDIHAQSSFAKSPRAAAMLGWAEKLFILVLYLLLVGRIGVSLLLQPVNALLIVGETFDVLFILLQRRAKSIGTGIYTSVVAFAGTSVGLLVQAGGHPFLPPVVGGLLMLAGGFLAFAAKLSLRRSFGLVAANRGVVLEGPYRFVRHPMYSGYLLLHLGFLTVNPIAWNFVIYGVEIAFLAARILEEEKVLGSDPAYAAMKDRVHWRLLPGIF